MKKLFALILVAGIILVSCAKEDNPEVEVTFSEEEVASIDMLNKTAFRLYDEFITDKTKAHTFSPLSVEFTLGMEANSVDHPDLVAFLEQNSLDSGNSLFEKIGKKLNRKKDGNESSLSNALFNNILYPKDKNLNSAAKNSFKADIFDEDFSASKEVTDKIHDWLMRNTKDFLSIPKVAVEPLWRRVLCNSLYFKHEWAFPFKVEDTKMADFTGADENVRKVPMMNITHKFNYYSSSSMTALEMPYANNSFSMMFILCDKDNVDYEDLQTVRKGLKDNTVKAFIPRFDTETSLLFDMETFGYQNLFGLHVARVKTDEKGTEAAAITELIDCASSLKPDVVFFKADRPFFYVITDNETGLILFIGRYC